MKYLAVICVSLASLSGAVAQMTHEETRVRTAYAKFAYAVEQGTIGAMAMEANNPLGMPIREEYAGMTREQRMAAAEVGFTLSDFVIGDARDIVHRKMVDLITGSLELVTSQSLYPEAILETYYREFPEIADWIAANTITKSTATRDAYCSPTGCGLPAKWVSKSLAAPIDPESREFLKMGGPEQAPRAANPRLTALTASFGVCNKTKKLPQSEIFSVKVLGQAL